MRKSLFPVLLLGLWTVSTQASAPVHITLKSASTVSADADGFFTLGAISDMSGGDATERARLRGVPVGRAPLPDQTRRLTPGDVLLKLRQAGFRPETDVQLDGATQIAVTVGGVVQAGASTDVKPGGSAASTVAAPVPSPPLVHRGDSVTILVQDDDMTITAKGLAREAGGAGDTIRVHRDGVMADLSVTVLDAQTVQLAL